MYCVSIIWYWLLWLRVFELRFWRCRQFYLPVFNHRFCWKRCRNPIRFCVFWLWFWRCRNPMRVCAFWHDIGRCRHICLRVFEHKLSCTGLRDFCWCRSPCACWENICWWTFPCASWGTLWNIRSFDWRALCFDWTALCFDDWRTLCLDSFLDDLCSRSFWEYITSIWCCTFSDSFPSSFGFCFEMVLCCILLCIMTFHI